MALIGLGSERFRWTGPWRPEDHRMCLPDSTQTRKQWLHLPQKAAIVALSS